jgi:hypothetical protein
MGKNSIIGTWIGIFAAWSMRPEPNQAASIRPASLSEALLFPPSIEPAFHLRSRCVAVRKERTSLGLRSGSVSEDPRSAHGAEFQNALGRGPPIIASTHCPVGTGDALIRAGHRSISTFIAPGIR